MSYYPGLNNARRITFEYVMLKGVNDSPQDAKELVQLIRGIPAKINLIPSIHGQDLLLSAQHLRRSMRFQILFLELGTHRPFVRPVGVTS